MHLADSRISEAARTEISAKLLNTPAGELAAENVISAESAFILGLTGLAAVLVFFGVLLVGFAYVWKRGDIDWVRTVISERTASRPQATSTSAARPETQTVS